MYLRLFYYIFLFLTSAFVLSAQANEKQTQDYFNKIKNDPIALQTFLFKMPKGGELHTHSDGATYAENLIGYGNDDLICINKDSMTAYYNTHCPENRTLAKVTKDIDLYNRMLSSWSMLNFPLKVLSGHDHFFMTFFKFGAITAVHIPDILLEMIKRAADQNEVYQEIMIAPNVKELIKLGNQVGWKGDFKKMRKVLFDRGLKNEITKIKKLVNEYDLKVKNSLHCKTSKKDLACQMTWRYQYVTLRDQSPAAVFTQLLAAFELAKEEPHIVGINLAQAEDWPISMKDYRLHMKIIGFLHRLYPTVKISLHAGELTTGLVPPKGLRFHIGDAINTAKANRIGHGLDISYEDHSKELLKQMAKNHILVETNLTSNADVVGLEGKRHPISLYIKNKIPISLSTDDEGILRTDLTQEFKRAVLTYDFDYLTLKNFARNSIEFSFLPGESLWKDYQYSAMINACQNDIAQAKPEKSDCKTFLSKNKKAQVQWRLEKRFQTFESQFN